MLLPNLTAVGMTGGLFILRKPDGEVLPLHISELTMFPDVLVTLTGDEGAGLRQNFPDPTQPHGFDLLAAAEHIMTECVRAEVALLTHPARQVVPHG